jgi:hypothetical protein
MGAIADYQNPRTADHAPSRFRAKWLIPALLLYGVYCSTCFYIEFMARERFQVPSDADVASVTERVAHLRIELARTNRLAEMREWGPYATYDAFLIALLLGGIALAIVYGGRTIWRGVNRDSVYKAKTIVVGTMFVVLAAVVLVGWPGFVAMKLSETKRTQYQIVDTGPLHR